MRRYRHNRNTKKHKEGVILSFKNYLSYAKRTVFAVLIGGGILAAFGPYTFDKYFAWKNRPIIKVYAHEYYVGDIIDQLSTNVHHPVMDILRNAANTVGNMKLRIINEGNATANNITFNLRFLDYKSINYSIWKSDADCDVRVMPSTDLSSYYKSALCVDIDPRELSDGQRGYFIKIPELRKNSEVQFNYSVEGKQYPPIKGEASEFLCDNASVEVFHYYSVNKEKESCYTGTVSVPH